MGINQGVVVKGRAASTALGRWHSAGCWGWKGVSTVVATAAFLVACGNDANPGNTTPVGSVARASTEPAAAPVPASTAGAGTAAGAAQGVGQAVVEVGGQRHGFVVIQCLRDVKSQLSEAVIEFQLDAVPSATPPDVIKRLLGVIDAGDKVLAELQPVVKFGPILSITRVAGGGEWLSITDLDTIEITSDGDPTDPAARSLKVAGGASGATVTGTTATSGGMATVSASCP